jgi:hypothetical protein
VGVPEIAHVEEFILKPVGILGVIVQLEGVPPVILGVSVVMAEFFKSITELEAKLNVCGLVSKPESTTAIYIEVEVDPTTLEAVTV